MNEMLSILLAVEQCDVPEPGGASLAVWAVAMFAGLWWLFRPKKDD